MKTIATLAVASLLSSCWGGFSSLQVSMPGEQAVVAPAPLPADPEVSFEEILVRVFSDPLFRPKPALPDPGQ